MKRRDQQVVDCGENEEDDEDDEENNEFEEENMNDDRAKNKWVNNCGVHAIRKSQERIINEVFLYLLGSEDNKVRLESARSLVRFIMNMQFQEMCSNPNQNVLLSAAEAYLKADGFSPNLLNSSVVDNDAYNLHTIGFILDRSSTRGGVSSSSSSSSYASSASGFTTPSSLLHGGMGAKKGQYRYSCSPLSAPSLHSSLPWFSKTNQILNNNFIQPFYSLIKHWPSNVSNTHVINNSLNKCTEHNLNYVVPILVKMLIESIDKFQMIGCLEALDFIFQVNI